MAENTEQFDREGSPEFSDEAIRGFFLGKLSAEEQPKFESRLFTDEGLERRVRLAEFELADDYAFERLSTVERALCEEKFLAGADRHRTVLVSQALRDRMASTSATAPYETKTPVRARVLPLFGFRRPAWGFAMAVVMLVLLVGAAWLVKRETPRIKEFVVRHRPARSSKQEAQHPPSASPAPFHQTTPAPMPDHGATVSPVIRSVSLFAGAAREGGSPVVNLPRGDHDIVRLYLTIKPNQGGPYRADILTIDGESVFSAQIASDSGTAGVEFDVPARLLKTGDYQIRLSRTTDGSNEDVVRYYVRVSQ